jgi:hypothetical protein
MRICQLLSLSVLARLIPLYPNSHRAQQAALQSLCLIKFLNGSTPRPTDIALLEAASRLYSILHFTGGKVGAANLWRTSVDKTLAFCRDAFLTLRTTFPTDSEFYVWFYPCSVVNNVQVRRHAAPLTEDPIVWIPLNIDRLRCGVVVLCDLLR